MNKTIFSVAIACIFLGFSCDSGDDGNTSFGSIPDDTPINEITEEEAYEICVDFVEQIETVITPEVMCTIIGIEAAPLLDKKLGIGEAAACKVTYSMCMGYKKKFELIDCEKGSGFKEYEDCKATAGEMDQCALDTLAVFEASVGDLDCSSSFEQPEEPASCEALDKQCPDLDIFPSFDEKL